MFNQKLKIMKKKIYLSLTVSTFFLCAINLFGQDGSGNNTAQTFNLFAGYGTHGIVCGGNWRIATTNSGNSGTRLYGDISFQGITFSQPLTFNGQQYNSDTWITSWGGGIAQEFYLAPSFHIAPFLGVRFDDAKFKDNFINTTIGNGELIRYWNGVEVGSRLKQDYGSSRLAFDIGCCFNIRLFSRLWLNVKGAVSPIKYNNNDSMYGKYWADTPHLNDYAINRSIFRVEGTLSLGF
jgi:hypothetical protein